MEKKVKELKAQNVVQMKMNVLERRMNVLERIMDDTAAIAQDLMEIRRLTSKLMQSTKVVEAYDTATELLETCQMCGVGCRWEHKKLANLICDLDELLNGKTILPLTKDSTPEEINAVIDEMIKAKDRYMALKTSN